jgi:hypothetical protein
MVDPRKNHPSLSRMLGAIVRIVRAEIAAQTVLAIRGETMWGRATEGGRSVNFVNFGAAPRATRPALSTR